jgi:hypothetical protein
MKLLLLNPNSTDQMTSLIADTARAAGAADVQVVNPKDGPAAIETSEDEAEAIVHLQDLLASRTQPDRECRCRNHRLLWGSWIRADRQFRSSSGLRHRPAVIGRRIVTFGRDRHGRRKAFRRANYGDARRLLRASSSHRPDRGIRSLGA